jgi:tetratricopeptide (TPR) repeat protein
MRSARRSILAFLILLTAAFAGCATSLPSTGVRMPVPVNAVESKSEPAVNPAVQRDFAGALSAMKLGRYQDAERMLLALTRLHPELSGPYANLGIVYFRLGKMPAATEALEKAIAINPDRAAYHNQLGIVYRQSGQLDKAREAYARALQIDSNYLNTHLNLGILYDLYLQDQGKALQHYERYQALLPSADVQVNKWIVDLKQRQQTAEKTAMRNDR